MIAIEGRPGGKRICINNSFYYSGQQKPQQGALRISDLPGRFTPVERRRRHSLFLAAYIEGERFSF
jgi:hypothetical protein